MSDSVAEFVYEVELLKENIWRFGLDSTAKLAHKVAERWEETVMRAF